MPDPSPPTAPPIQTMPLRVAPGPAIVRGQVLVASLHVEPGRIPEPGGVATFGPMERRADDTWPLPTAVAATPLPARDHEDVLLAYVPRLAPPGSGQGPAAADLVWPDDLDDETKAAALDLLRSRRVIRG